MALFRAVLIPKRNGIKSSKMEKNQIYNLNSQEYNLKLAEILKKFEEFKVPEWIQFVKSSSAKERPIEDIDFWYKRAASILRHIYKKKIVGVNRLRTTYGGKKNRGARPEKFKRGGGKIIRTILQQTDKAGLTEKEEIKTKRGRKLTVKGKKLLESLEDKK